MLLDNLQKRKMNTEGEQKQEPKKFILTTLVPEQYPVTRVAKFTTEFPFFYFTQNKKGLSRDINYQDFDNAGRPIKWAVIPNRGVGVPAIEAHAVWTRLIKPKWDELRFEDGRLLDILPLGGVRECLRKVGWTEGGWEARRLLKVIHQISAASCEADCFIPTIKKNEKGETLFRHIKAMYSRLTLYAIGEKHISEEDLTDGKFNFEFDLNDTLYIIFNPIEKAMQEGQPLRPLDNQYMFSVRPSARRWYELMIGEIFGVVKNGGTHWEIIYSDYLKQHHTLTRHTARWKVMEQMNDIIRDHITSGFIDRVTYHRIKEPNKEIDFLIRYYPGKGAKESIMRVLRASYSEKKIPGLVENKPRKPRAKKEEFPPSTEMDLIHDNQNKEVVIEETAIYLLPAPSINIPSELVLALTERGVMGALSLLKNLPADAFEKVPDVIEYWDTIRGEKGAGLLVNFLKSTEPLPTTFESSRQRRERQLAVEREEQIKKTKELLQFSYENYVKEAIDRYIRDFVPQDEYGKRVEAFKEELRTQEGRTSWNQSPEAIAHIAAREVRMEIAEGVVVLSFPAFCRSEAPIIRRKYGVNPIELGIPYVDDVGEDGMVN